MSEEREMNEERRAVFLVGASGVGKTAVAADMALRDPWRGRVHHFDDIGIPSLERMAAEHGSPEAWQQWATAEWVARLGKLGPPVQLLEGQTRPSFINEALAEHPGLAPVIILLDCRPDVRTRRLVELRESPELATPRMDAWAAYLRGQADALGLPVIDTSDLDVSSVADQVERIALEGLWLGGPAER